MKFVWRLSVWQAFINVGNINNQLLKFERAQTNDSQEVVTPPIAKHMLVFMVRGILVSLNSLMFNSPVLALRVMLYFHSYGSALSDLKYVVWKLLLLLQMEPQQIKNSSRCTSRHQAKMVRWSTRQSTCTVQKNAPFSSYLMYPTSLKPFATAGVIHLHTSIHEQWRWVYNLLELQWWKLL